MDLISVDILRPLVAGVLLWSCFMIAVQLGEALSEAVDRRRGRS